MSWVAIGSAVIGGGASLIGTQMSNSSREKQAKQQASYDPLAGLRAQLQGLASQVPGLVARQKADTATQISGLKDEGYKNIGENVYGARGFGKTSIEDRLRTELATKLAKTQSSADLDAEKWGLGQQADILQGTARMYPGAPEAGGSSGGGMSGIGEMLGASMGGANFGDITDFISKMGAGNASTGLAPAQSDYIEELKKRPASFYSPSFGAQ